VPLVGAVAQILYSKLMAGVLTFPGSAIYWERRYRSGGNAGTGSYALLAQFKADVINSYVSDHGVRTVIDFGCGDGNQLLLAEYPSYIGFDVSRTAISVCLRLFQDDASKTFRLMSEYKGERADLVLSLDVLYHLVEQETFEDYMQVVFAASSDHVIIYSTDFEDNSGHDGMHVRHRKFTRWIRDKLPEWELVNTFPNRYPYRWYSPKGSRSEFFIYRMRDKQAMVESRS
jgi:SAM-dependent methyltransferase